ncbi:sensor histidine kinase [Parafilimonas sp.]|uniref:sensor histidine kinase n=1 Tax=Parafilimonas sp. TaxID=1969739 RepID=UPI0039E2C837
MQKKQLAYWWCQFAGWAFYGASLLFFTWVFHLDLSAIFVARILLAMSFGLVFTHLLRLIILRLKLTPPIFGRQWLQLFGLTLLVCIAYSYISSTIVEWLHLYDPKIKASIPERFFLNLANDSPIILVWLSIYYLWHYIENSRNTKIDSVKMESLVKELQLKTIKAHINPHFIFNALNSIRALVDENPERARTAITELSNILRSSMQAEKTETTSLEKELSIVKDYLELEQIRFEDRLRVEYEIDEDTLDQQVPPMMLQTLVENAIKHGISKQINGGLIRVISDFTDSHHELIVENTGHLNGASNLDGFGIASTINRLKLLYGNDADFEIKNINGNMVKARVILPVTAISFLK